jgi:hypothetical protein
MKEALGINFCEIWNCEFLFPGKTEFRPRTKFYTSHFLFDRAYPGIFKEGRLPFL